jgi:hypothetical protein
MAISEFLKCRLFYLTNVINPLQKLELEQNDSAI